MWRKTQSLYQVEFQDLKVTMLKSFPHLRQKWVCGKYTNKSACEASNKQVVSYRKFLQLWEQFCPNVVIAKPMTDLCSICQQNTTKLQQAANLSETEKIECIKAQQEHLNPTQAKRDFYKYACNLSEKTIESLENGNLLNLRSRTACSLTATIHYSFDYAQQVHIPSNPMQPGPIYFKTPRKCGIFGFPRQVNFLIDEAASTGKGANATISYVHYYFKNYGLLGEDWTNYIFIPSLGYVH